MSAKISKYAFEYSDKKIMKFINNSLLKFSLRISIWSPETVTAYNDGLKPARTDKTLLLKQLRQSIEHLRRMNIIAQ